MDAKKKMIIAKGNPVSSDVISYSFNDTSGKYEITFNSICIVDDAVRDCNDELLYKE